MFSYPLSLAIPGRDNLVPSCTGSPTMHPAIGTGSGMAITMEYLVMRLDHLIKLLQDYLDVNR
jgi:hypothetical protein